MKEKAKAKEILQKIIPFLGIILMIIIFQVGGEGKLLTKGNINSILNQTVYIGFVIRWCYRFQRFSCDFSCEHRSTCRSSIYYKHSCSTGMVRIERSCFRIFAGFAIYHITMHHVYVSWNLKYGMCITEI